MSMIQKTRTKSSSICILALLLAVSAAAMHGQPCGSWHDPSPHKVQFVTVRDGIRLEVLDWGGSGPPVVLLGGYTTAHIYDELAPRLADSAHVYGITRRGLGDSSKPPGGYTAQDSAEDVLQVLDALKLEKPILAGHSFGGQDLNVIGALHPDRVAGLVYLNSAEDISLGPVSKSVKAPEQSQLPQTIRNPTQPDKTSFTAYREWQRTTYGMAFPESELRQLFPCTQNGTVGQYSVSQEVRDAMFASLTSPNYARIRVPVLALFALPASLEDQMKRYKPQTPSEGAALALRYGLELAWVARNEDALKRGIPGARIVELADANSYIFLSNEADVLREMHAFLAELR
jgi:non-heme chloroperoxidase